MIVTIALAFTRQRLVSPMRMIVTIFFFGFGIVGVLLSGSLAMLARRHGLVEHVVGFGRTQANLDVAVERKLIDSATRDAAAAARGAHLVVLAVPIMTMPALLIKYHWRRCVYSPWFGFTMSFQWRPFSRFRMKPSPENGPITTT